MGVGLARLPPQILDDLVHLLWREADVVVQAAGHGRRMRATAEPILLAQTEQAVRGCLAGIDAQAFLQMAQDVIAASQSAA